MNNVQENKLRKIIKSILLEGSYHKDIFAGLHSSPGGKKLAASDSNPTHDNTEEVLSLIGKLRDKLREPQKRIDIIRIYGKKGKELLSILDNMTPPREAHVDPNSTRSFPAPDFNNK